MNNIVHSINKTNCDIFVKHMELLRGNSVYQILKKNVELSRAKCRIFMDNVEVLKAKISVKFLLKNSVSNFQEKYQTLLRKVKFRIFMENIAKHSKSQC